MRYHFKSPTIYRALYGEVYRCDHPVYSVCTLYRVGKRGLAVIQQYRDETHKTTWWGEVEPRLRNAIYTHPRFKDFFDERAREAPEGFYPTVSIRQLMRTLGMKPLPKERWETMFDRREI